MTMEEGVIDIELTDLPVGGEGDGENNPDGSLFNHRAKCLDEIDAMLLGEAAQHPPCFVAVEPTVRLELLAKNALVGDDIDVGGGEGVAKDPTCRWRGGRCTSQTWPLASSAL
jgi:hypothetical protein